MIVTTQPNDRREEPHQSTEEARNQDNGDPRGDDGTVDGTDTSRRPNRNDRRQSCKCTAEHNRKADADRFATPYLQECRHPAH